MSVRLDKWLQVARLFKTRSQAGRACRLGRVRVNGHGAKAHRPVALGDRIEVRLGDWTRIVEVKELRDRPLPKKEAKRLFEDHSPPRPEPDPLLGLLRRSRPVEREGGAGRPSKRERRQLDRLRDR